jgi:hypothetical protein
MAAVLILTFSVFALIRFAISQWRMIWLTTANQPLSDALRAATGFDCNAIAGNDFSTLVELCDELSPRIRKATPWLREVSWYYALMSKVERAFHSFQPGIGGWAAREMKTCARYVAVVLDQNLAIDMDRRAAAARSI